MKRKTRFIAIEANEWLVYAVLPHKGRGMSVEEISQVIETIPTWKQSPIFWVGKFLSPVDVDVALKRLCEKGLVEKVETPEGERYRRNFHNFKLSIKICHHCGSPFLARNMKRKFCSDSCRVRHHFQVCDKCREKSMRNLERLVKIKLNDLNFVFEVE